MAQNITFNGVVYTIPDVGDDSWGLNLSNFFIAIPQGTLQKSGGTFTLSNDINFGATYGLLSNYFKTRGANPSSSGLIRLNLTDTIAWRNNANTADLSLAINASDELTFNGATFQPGGNYITELTGDVTALGPGSVAATIGANKVLDSMIRQSAGLSLIGRSANSTGNVADITAATDNSVLLRSGTSLLFNLLTNNNIDPAAAIAYSKLSLAASIVNADISPSAAIAYSKLNLTGAIVNADIAALAAIAYSKLNLTGSIVNADIGALAAIAYSKLSLTGSIVNADISASAAIAYSKLNLAGAILNSDLAGSIAFSKLVPLTITRALVSDGSGIISVSPVTSTELGYLSGVTSSVQTQLSGKLANPLTTTGDIIYASSGSTPARVGIGSSGQVLKVIAGVPSWSTFSGGINYASANPDAEADTSGWSTYADGAATPTDGTGGSPTATFTRSTSSPLRGTASFLYTVGALGNGASFAFTIDSADQAKALQVSFDWTPTATLADGDYTAYVYDVTNSLLTQIIPFKLGSAVSGTQYSFKGTFQTASNSTSYRLIIHQAVATPAGNLKLDNVYIGPQSVSYTSPMTDWISFTPTWTSSGTAPSIGNGTLAGRYKRVGDKAEIQISMISGTTTTYGTGSYQFSLPSGVSIDTSKLISASPNSQILGYSQTQRTAVGNIYDAAVTLFSSTAVYAGRPADGTGSSAWTDTFPATWTASTAGQNMQLLFMAPILGWSSSAAISQSDSSEGRVVAMTAVLNSGSQTNTGNWQDVTGYSSARVDTLSSFNTSTGVYTIAVPGPYRISGQISFTSNATGFRGIRLMVGSAVEVYGNGVSGNATDTLMNTSVLPAYVKILKAGDTVKLQAFQSSGGNLAYSAVTDPQSFFVVERVSGNQSITASESVSFRSSGTPTGTVNSSRNIIVFPAAPAGEDSHGAYNSSTGNYVCPLPGRYLITGAYRVNATATANPFVTLAIYKNGVEVQYGNHDYTGITLSFLSEAVSGSVKCIAGDTLALYSQTNGTSPAFTGGNINYINIVRVGN